MLHSRLARYIDVKIYLENNGNCIVIGVKRIDEPQII